MVDDIRIAAPVHRDGLRNADAAASERLNAQVTGEGQLRPRSRAVDICGCYYRARTVQQIHGPITSAGILRRKRYVHCADVALGIAVACSVRRAVAGTRIGEVSPVTPWVSTEALTPVALEEK